MSEITYSRTSGSEVLPGTIAYIQARGDVPDAEKLDPAFRYDYDNATSEQRAEFNRLIKNSLTRPPSWLRFALASSAAHVYPYPGEAPELSGYPANGTLNFNLRQAALKLGIPLDNLMEELLNFSGLVQLVTLPVGTPMYRTVGLTVEGVIHGSVINKLLGNYWEPMCPSDYADESSWRAATAVLAEWNGDLGYVQVELSRPVTVLFGMASMQKIGRNGNAVLPGGGMQYYVPCLKDTDLVKSLTGRPLTEIIKKTEFGKRRHP